MNLQCKTLLAICEKTNYFYKVLQGFYLAKTSEHEKLVWAKHTSQKGLQKLIATINHACHEALMSVFIVAFFMEKKQIFFHKFPNLCNLLVSCNATMTRKIVS